MFANPLALALFTLAYLLNPTRTFHYRARVVQSRKLIRKQVSRVCKATVSMV